MLNGRRPDPIPAIVHAHEPSEHNHGRLEIGGTTNQEVGEHPVNGERRVYS